ncbi:MAG: PaaI family thioesterase [Candidatus Hydrogenedentes bacterium]|nr:PaaI family thioesterase [Candidatus Hydrogenedentota bacterium]
MTTDDPRLSGYEQWGDHDPFETLTGPLYLKREPDGRHRCAFAVLPHHMNGQGAIHGGMLMTFADFALFSFARDILNGPTVTVSFNCDFTAPAYAGDFLEATGEVVHQSRKMIFVQGVLRRGETVVLRFSGLLKRVTVRSAAE